MSELKKMLEEYGADYQAIMGRFMGNEAFYLRIFSMFPKDESLTKLGQALSNNDYTAAFDAAHTLKGVTGNLGLSPLYQAVCAIVEPLRTGEAENDYPVLYGMIRLEYEKVIKLLSKLNGGAA